MHRWLFAAFILAPSLPAWGQPEGETPPEETPEGEVPDGDQPPAKAVAAEAPMPAPPPPEPVKKPVPSSFMDTRLNFTLTNENVFAAPGETIPSVPGWRFGRPNSLGTLFFDNYDTRFSGYESLSHAVLYKHQDVGQWEAEGALVLRINDIAERRLDLSDAGSYIRVSKWLDPARADGRRFSITAFPTSSDRFRLGYSYRLSWGGSPEYQRSGQAVPGIKVQYETGSMYGFIGAKSAIVLNRETAEQEAVLAGLAGFGFDVSETLHIDVNGGFFDRGSNELQDVLSERVQLYGASVQVALHRGMPIASSIDYKLYINDPERVVHLFRKEEYPGGLSWMVAAEGTVLAQTLKDPEKSGSTRVQYGRAGDVNVRVKSDRTRYRLDLQYRDLAFILHATPSLPTFSDFPDVYEKTPDLFAAAGVDQNLPDYDLTIGVVVGIDMPATLTTPTGVVPGDTVEGSGQSTAVIRNEGDITILPKGEAAAAQLAGKLTAQLDFAENFASIVDAYFSYDPNQTRLRRDDPEASLTREFGEFNQLGFNVTLQARF